MIPAELIARLAELYDTYNNAFDPLSAECAEAKRQFGEMVLRVHGTHAPDVDFRVFRYELVQRCREYLAEELSRLPPLGR